MIIENCDFGSMNENRSNNYGSFFKNGVTTQIITTPKDGNSLEVIILPSIDPSKGPSSIKTSILPYRETDSDRLDKITQTPAFTHWAKTCRAYTFFGPNKRMFVSSLTGKSYRSVKLKNGKVAMYPMKYLDPIVDIGNWIHFNKDKDPLANKYSYLINKPEQGSAVLPRKPKDYIISNALIRSKDKWSYTVIAYTTMAYVDLIKMLSIKTGRNETPVSPEFEDFLFGDITSPVSGSILEVSKKQIETSVDSGGIEFAGFNISLDNKTLKGRIPIDIQINDDILSKRVILNDDEYIDIWSYQKIVNMLVEDEIVPPELIYKACKPGTEVTVLPKSKNTDIDEISLSDEDDVNTDNISSESYNVNLKPRIENSIPEKVEIESNKPSPEELKEYTELYNKLTKGSFDADDISKFSDYQKKYGDYTQFLNK